MRALFVSLAVIVIALGVRCEASEVASESDPASLFSGSNATNHDSTDGDTSPDAQVGSNVGSDVVGDEAAAGEPPGTDSYPRVTAMETAILGATYINEDLSARLTRLETKAFGKPSSNADLSDRTDALQQFAETKLHRKLFKEDPDFVSVSDNGQRSSAQTGSATSAGGSGDSAGAGGPNRSRQLLTAVGTSLINMAGLGLPAAAMGMGPVGFGGVRVRHRQDVPQSEQTEAPRNEPMEDPAVMEKSPPPASAKLLTKVGWCEVQVFGHTFPAMHLPQRLNQLNTEIEFAPGKSNIELMDCTAAMLEAAQNHKQRSAGASPVPQ
jgi:hypothetical protein